MDKQEQLATRSASGKTSRTMYVRSDGGRIAYDAAGSGPLVVCVPSMGDLRGEYRYLVPQLVAAGYRAVTMDVRGHGESSTRWDDYSVAGVGRDIIALIRHLGSGPATVIGVSMAGGAAIYAAAEAHDLVSGLVLVDAFVRDIPGPWWYRLLYPVLFAAPWGRVVWAKYYATLYPTKKPPDFADYVARLRANLGERGRMAALRKMIYASKSASEERIGMVSAPAFVIMGSKDPDFKNPQAEATLVADRLRATVHMVEGAGHYPHAEMPEEVGPVVIGFLQQVTGGERLAAGVAQP